MLEAADGLDARRLVRAGGVQLVISDMTLPGLVGRRLRRAIRDDAVLCDVAVLLLDGDAPGDEGAADGVPAGPFNGRQLLAAPVRLARRG